jgi:hypothetical protein
MAGFTMPKKGEGAAMLRDLREEERPARDEESSPVSTEVRAPVLTDVRKHGEQEARTDASPQASEDVREEASEDGRPSASTEGSPPARKEERPQGQKAVRQSGRAAAGSVSGQAYFLDVVDAALASREPLMGGVKATVDMSPELSSRAKRYLADHRGQNTRQVIIALFDAFLTEKGY